MRVCYSFTDELDPGETVRIVPEDEVLFILLDRGAERDALARRMSQEVSRHVQDAWLWVGDVVASA